MRKFFTLLTSACLCTAASFAQNWEQDSISYDGTQRIFKTYHSQPGQQNMAVVLMLHGLGGSMNDVDMTNFKAIADTANLLLLAPQALEYVDPNVGSLGAAWNSGITVTGTLFGDITLSPDVDDAGMLLALIDSIKVKFSVDADRIYVAGFSNGAFMTQRLICEHPEVFKAAASHSGTKANTLTQCADLPIPIVHFHGTADPTVDDLGNFHMLGYAFPVGLSVAELVSHWRDINGANGAEHIEIIGSTTDPKYITRYRYDGGTRVHYYKIHQGDHSWYSYGSINNDFDQALATWHFFLGNDELPSSIAKNKKSPQINLYPNPASDYISLSSRLGSAEEVAIVDVLGQVQMREPFKEKVNIAALPKGMYWVQLLHQGSTIGTTQFVKN
jgi:polyhydroxybutyrate depolymerase